MSWDEDRVCAMVRAAVERKLPMFAAFRDLEADDLVQDVLIAVRDAYRKFNPELASLSTFVGVVAGRRLIDIYRRRSRQAGREGVYAEAQYGRPEWSGRGENLQPTIVVEADEVIDPPEETEDFEGEVVHEGSLADWLSTVYTHARRNLESPRLRSGRRYHNAAQAIASIALKRKLKLTTRGIRGLFEDREELRRAVQFKHLPDQSWFVRSEKVASQFLRAPAGE
jgi:RNA polymerase sigma factor (sigma-70 family)